MPPVASPMQGTVVSIDVAVGDVVRVGQELVVLESMKMEHVVEAQASGVVTAIAIAIGDTVMAGDALLSFEARAADDEVAHVADDAVDQDRVRADLAEVVERHDIGLDARRPEAVARRRATGQRTARENVADLVDPGSFVEYAPLVVAAQRRRRSLEELIARTPADGLVGGIGTVDGQSTIAMSYDYTVLAGTQGLWNHEKKDRLFDLAERMRLPVVFFTEGGGGRPGDTDGSGVSGLDCLAFNYFARLSGLVPLVGITSGYCFAGNAALLGCCDVIIATEGSNIGMGGPAMIEGGGLGVYDPKAIGPADVQNENGVIDVLVADEAEAVRVAKQYLGYFRGAVDEWECAAATSLRHLIPENRVRAYDVRTVIDALFDTGSVLELRRAFAPGMITAFARVEGRPVGVVANNPLHLGGAIDTQGADKAARFLQLCDAFDVPVLFLCDTPGFMVGPESEATAAVRHVSRMFVTGANLTVPFATIILRKGYGLGAQAMAGGSFKAPLFCVAWPTGEFGGMNLEGAVRLGQRRELEAIEDPEERERTFQTMVDRMYQWGKAINSASHFEIDDVIDPADSRRWITTMLAAAPDPAHRSGKSAPTSTPGSATLARMSEYTSTYDALAARWDSWSGEIMPDVRAAWARQIEVPISEGEKVVELGCGTGIPVGEWLAHRYEYTGVDASDGMLRIARRHVTDGNFVHADMETMSFDAGSLGAVIAFYSIDHVPRTQHAELFGRIASWLRPGGMFVASLHSGPEEDFVDPNWLDAGPMGWSGFDGAKNLELIAAAGLDVAESEVIDQVEPDGTVVKPLWVVARKPH